MPLRKNPSPNLPSVFFLLLLLSISLTVLSPATAQVCGDSVTVAFGDTLSGIADRCNTSVKALMAANPQLPGPHRLRVGMTLKMPGKSPEQAQDVRKTPDRSVHDGKASLTLSSPEGAPEEPVTVTVSDFPPQTAIRIGAGPADSEYEILRTTMTDAQGAASETVRLPPSAEAGRDWIFVAETEDHRIKAKSDAYAVRFEGEGDRNRSDLVTIRGMLTGEGTECQAMRGEDGKLYTFSGIGGGYGPGDCVTVVGKAAQMSFCRQGTALDVKRIEKR